MIILKVRDVLFLAERYPSKNNPNTFLFYQQLIHKIADMGIRCHVISPVAVNLIPKSNRPPKSWVDKTSNGAAIVITAPRYIAFPRKIFNINISRISDWLLSYVVKNRIKLMNIHPDAFYGHFLKPAGMIAAKIGKELKTSSFCAYGESTPWGVNAYGKCFSKQLFRDLSGVVAVSTEIKRYLVDNELCDSSKIEVFPNGIDTNLFYQQDKLKARKSFGFPEDSFIVAYTGSFSHRKGAMRLNAVANRLPNINFILAGKGEEIPEADNIIFKKPVPHEDMPKFLGTADVFLLPTLNEGCCNAIIEALASGLPVISSNLPFNDDILDSTCAIRIDPLDIEMIVRAVTTLYEDDALRTNLRHGALEKVKKLSLQKRANDIIRWMENKIDKQKCIN